MYKELTRLDPADSLNYSCCGEAYMYTNQPEKAIDAFKKAIQLDPNELSAYEDLARACQASGRIPEAEQVYMQALQVHPTDPEKWIALGDAYTGWGRYEGGAFGVRARLVTNT